jgi:phosphate-selective porin
MRSGEHRGECLVIVILFCLILPASLPAQEPADQASSNQQSKRFEWISYFQLRYSGIEDAPDLYALRRFKLVLQGHLKPQVEFMIQGIFTDGDRSTTDGRAYVQDAWIKFTGWKYGQLTIGQLKPPFGLERFTNIYQLVSFDRSQATDHLIPSGQLGGSYGRDRGAQLDAWLASQRFYYAAGIFDGNGANNTWRGNSPLVTARMVGVLYRSPAKSSRKDRVTLGGAFSTRKDHAQDFTAALPGTAPLGYARFAGRDTHCNLEASADFGPISFRSEYFYAWYDPNRMPFVAVRASGFYAQGAYSFGPHYQAFAKYETFNPNRAVADSHDLRWTTLGVNWRIHGDRLRVGADYVIKREVRRQVPNNALLVQFQMFLH